MNLTSHIRALLIASAVTIFCSCSHKLMESSGPDTIRIDVSVQQHDHHNYTLSIDTIEQWRGWHGRRVNLKDEHYPDVMQVQVTDSHTGKILYVDSHNPSAISDDRGLPAVVPIFIPKPKDECDVKITIFDYDRNTRIPNSSIGLHLDKKQLNRLKRAKGSSPTPYRTIRKAVDPARCINLAILAEGYTAEEAEKFYRQAQQLDSVMFVHEPAFRDNADKFNVVAVMIESEESGISIPSANKHINSAMHAHFDSFGLERLITVPDTRTFWNVLENIPAHQILILANTTKYGGSGSYGDYAIVSAGQDHFAEILIHEFGHSFGALADEYEGGYDLMYTPDVEPLEPNITTNNSTINCKWQNLIDSGEASLIEGAGYQSKGVWRGCEHCLMREISDQRFCAVCTQALKRMIDYYTVEKR